MSQLVHPRQMHLRCKFGDRTRRSVTCRNNAHSKFFFYDDLVKTPWSKSGRPGFRFLIRVHQ